MSLSAVDRHTCAVGPLDMAFCWGNNDSSQLGTGGTTPRSFPSQVYDL